ncbi:MAG: hypothetical protein JWQ19_877 [Subtercola sp.]|nr:hypothetical protein [Subtercola sp.]
MRASGVTETGGQVVSPSAGVLAVSTLRGRVLLAAEVSSLDAVRDVIAQIWSVQTRTNRTRGQVFIEVASAEQIEQISLLEPLETPELITVTWLARDARSGAPGTGELCGAGVALGRAVRAWVSEMTTGDPEVDGEELSAVVFGDSAEIVDLRLDLISTLGLVSV